MLNRCISLLLALLSTATLQYNMIARQFAPDEYLLLVNRTYTIGADEEPSDLVRPNVKHTSSAILMRREAAQALEALFAAAKAEANITLYAHSGYRSYATQAIIYQRKVKATKSVEAAQRLVAPPGASEHQLGLAMDVKGSKDGALNAAFGNTKAGKWLSENAHRFGFIIRYKAEWTQTTGYSYEPWHIRYVGSTHAQILYALDIPLEDYVLSLRSIVPEAYLKGETP